MENQTRRITLEDLLEVKQQREREGKSTAYFYSDVLGGELLVKKMPLRKVMDILDDKETKDMDVNSQLIYGCCPLFQDKRLQDEYVCAEPFEIVEKVLDDNLGEIGKLVGFILKLYGLDNLEDNIKN